jgi:hypothetical protein
MKRTPFKKRNTIIKQGRVSEINHMARQKIAEIAEERGIDHCELNFDGCQEYYTLAPAHKNRREWYRGNVDLLSDYNQWICACQPCHERIDSDENLKDEIFNKLRPQ